MSIYNSNTKIKDAFKPAKESILAGFLSNPYSSTSAQAKVEGDTAEFLPAIAVEIKNDTAELGSGYSPTALKIDKIATTKVDGFILESETMEVDGDSIKPISDGTVQVALFGSGIRTYLPCETDLSNVNLSDVVYYDETNKTITANSADTIPTKLRIVGSVVSGYKREKQSDGSVIWKACSLVEVEF